MIYNNFEKSKLKVFPLTELQKSMYADIKLNICDYYECVEIKVREPLKTEILKSVLYDLMENQETLRTVYRIAQGKIPVQVLLSEFVVPLYLNRAPKIDIDTEPWNIMYNQTEGIIRLQYSHILMDGWSVSVFFEELFKRYNHISCGNNLCLNKAKKIEEYVREVKNCHIENSDNFWKTNCKGNATLLEKHVLRNGRAEEKIVVELSEKQKNYVKRYASQHRVTPAVIVYEAWARNLSVFCGCENVKVAIVQSGRSNLVDYDKTIGMYAQIVPMQVDVDKEREISISQINSYLNDVNVKSPAAGTICAESLGETVLRDVCDTLVAVENYPINREIMADLRNIKFYERPSYPFTLLVQTGEKMVCTLMTNKVELQKSLKGILKNFISILCDEVGCESIVVGKEVLFPDSVNLCRKIMNACKEYKEKTAIIDYEKTMTYGEVWDEILLRVGFLKSRGLVKHDVVGVYIGRSIEQLLWVYAIEVAGMVYVPFVDMPSEKALFMIQSANVKTIVSDCEDVWHVSCSWIKVDVDSKMVKMDNRITLDVDENDTAYILFTSGSTGNPKGCEISHKAIYNRLYWNAKALALNENTIQMYKTARSFDVSIIEIFSIFFMGGTLVVLKDGKEKEPDTLLDMIDFYKVNYIHFVPSMLKTMVDYMHMFTDIQKFCTIRTLVCSGEILLWSLVQSVYKMLPDENIKIINLYGPTEAAVDVSWYECERNKEYIITPIGKPISNIKLMILDDNNSVVPSGVKGELYISGIGLSSKYVNAPELTNRAFFILKNGERAYKTGDVAYQDGNGDIVVVGRNDDQIKWNGIRLEKYELVHQSMKSGLIHAAVVLYVKGNPDKLILCYEAKENCDDKLKEWLTVHLQKNIQPSDYLYVKSLPITSNGKTDNNKLLELYYDSIRNCNMETIDCIREGIGVGVSVENIEIKKTTRFSKTELEVSEIFKKILGNHHEFDKESNFFAFGGNSLSLIQLLLEIKRKWNIKLNSGEVYDFPSLEKIAEMIDKSECNETIDSTSLGMKDYNNQKSIAAFLVKNPSSTAYNMPIVFELQPMVSVSKLEEAWKKLLDKCMLFQQSYVVEGSKLIPVDVDETIEVLHVKLQSEDEIVDFKREFVRPFAWGKALARIAFVFVENNHEKSRYVFFDMSHLICDQNIVGKLLTSWFEIYTGNEVDIVGAPFKEIDFNYEYVTMENVKLFEDYSVIYPQYQGKLGRCPFRIEKNLTDEIRQVSKNHSASVFEILLAVFIQFCHYLTGKEKFVIETNTVNDDENDEMQLKTIPIITDMSKKLTLIDALQQVHNELVKGFKNDAQEVAYDVMFVREEKILQEKFAAIFSDAVTINSEVKNALTLFYSEDENALDFCFDFDMGLFSYEMITQLQRQFIVILEGVCHNLSVTLGSLTDIALLQKSLDQEYYPMNTIVRDNRTIQELFMKTCLASPNEIALYCGDDMVTRGQFLRQVLENANRLKKYITPGSFVGVLQDVGIDYMISIFSVLMAGGCFVPLDIRQPVQRNEKNMVSCGCRVCLTKIGVSLAQVTCVNLLKSMDFEITENTLDEYANKYIIENPAYCIFTSGSTGAPKACVVQQKNILNYMHWANSFYCHNQKQVFAFYTSPAVDMTITSTLMPLLFGHAIAIYPQEANSIKNLVHDSRITILKATPSHLRLLQGEEFSSKVKCLIIGGEQLTTELAELMQKQFGAKTKIYNEYGPTEASVACMIYQYQGSDPFTVVPIGKATDNMKVTIVNDANYLCLPGIQGELILEGTSVIPNYHNIDGPFVQVNKSLWRYSTGDRARMLSDGRIIYDGREDEQFKINGYRVELSEISHAAQEIEGIKDAYAILNEGKLWLFCVKKQGAYIEEVYLRKQLFKQLPNYMIPSRIRFIDTIPIASSGKTNVAELKHLCSDDGSRNKKSKHVIAEILRSCWIEVLGNEDFSNEDGFFEAGGNSLSIVVLKEKINKIYPQISVSDLFCYPSIATMTNYLSHEDEKDLVIVNAAESDERIAIVGVSFMLPQAETLQQLDDVFSKGRPVSGHVSSQRMEDEKKRLRDMGLDSLEHRFCIAPFLDRIDLFDHKYFHMTQEQAEVLNPTQRLFLLTVDRVFEDAGYSRESLKGKKCAVVAAAPTENFFDTYIHQCFPSLEELSSLNHVASIMTGRVQHFYDLHGPAYMLDCACSSGLEALHNACDLLKSNQCDMAVVGGVNLIETIDWADKKRQDVLSPYNYAKPFSDQADGTSRGEGSICLLLERESVAKENNHYIYASVIGSSTNNDGFSSSLTAPNGEEQRKLLLNAWNNAGISPDELSLIETHGTGTILGDSIEMDSLCKAMKDSSPGHCILSAAKSIYGHLDAISGLLGIVKTIVASEYNKIYPQNSHSAPMDKNWMASPFFRPNTVQTWSKEQSKRVVCGVSGFGLSGTNVHVVMELYIKEKPRVQEFSRLSLNRYWLSDAEVVFQTQRNDQVDVRRQKNRDTAEIRSTIEKKFKEMLNLEQIDASHTLLQLGIDSITIIQIKIFLKKEFGYDDDVDTADTIKSIVVKVHNNYGIGDALATRDEIGGLQIGSSDTVSVVNTSWRNYSIKYQLNDFIEQYMRKTAQSRNRMMDENLRWANGRFMTGYTPGLENLSYPILADRAKGAQMWDIDGNQYTDYAMGFGSIILGYNNAQVMDAVRKCTEDGVILGALMDSPFQLAQRICSLTGIERVSFCNSGTEAVMNLIRIARAATGREKIVVFGGAFHGTFDPVYVQKNEWQEGYEPIPRSEGTPLHYLRDIIMLPYGDDSALTEIVNCRESIAAVLVEPVQSRHPALQPKEFLTKLREITIDHSILLIFDEVINGFRSGLKGAQGYFGVDADLVAYGKVIGGGFPFGVFGGKAKYLDMIDHRGGLTSKGNTGKWVSTGGTFNAHPATIAAAHAVLDVLEKEGERIFNKINGFTKQIAQELNAFFGAHDMNYRIEYFCSQFIICGEDVINLRLLQYMMINEGIYVWEGGTCFISDAHTEDDIKIFIDSVKKCTIKIQEINQTIEKMDVVIGDGVHYKDFPRILKYLKNHQDIDMITALNETEFRALSHNVALRATRQDLSTITVKLNEKVDGVRLEQALSNVVNANRKLRCGIVWRRMIRPVFIEYNKVSVTLAVHNYLEDQLEIGLLEVINNKKEKGFVLDNAPLINFDLVTSEKDNYLIMTYYNSLFDGWSADVILKQIQHCMSEEKTSYKTNANKLSKNNMNWNEYNYYVDQKLEQVKKYWMQLGVSLHEKQIIHMDYSSNNMNMGEEELVFSEELVKLIGGWNNKSGISEAALYLTAMGKALDERIIITTVSGRNLPVENIENEVGLLSGLVVIDTTDLGRVQMQLTEVNKYPVLSHHKLAQYLGFSVEQLSSYVMVNGVVILNQISYTDTSNEGSLLGEIVEDKSFAHVPRRSYVLPRKSVKIVADKNLFSTENIRNTLLRFEKTLLEILRG